jgi:hypothetical protein
MVTQQDEEVLSVDTHSREADLAKEARWIDAKESGFSADYRT